MSTSPDSVSSGDSVGGNDGYVQIERKSKILPFDPKKTVWPIWSKQFLQRAYERGYRSILVGDQEIVSDSVAKGLKKVDDKLKWYKLNNKAYTDLMMCFTDDVNFGIIEDAVTDELEMGNAAIAWKNLCNKHDPNTASTLVQLKKEFSTNRLKKISIDPEVWVPELEVL